MQLAKGAVRPVGVTPLSLLRSRNTGADLTSRVGMVDILTAYSPAVGVERNKGSHDEGGDADRTA